MESTAADQLHSITNCNQLFACDQCDGVFPRLVELQLHLESHKEERPYVCAQCGRSYRHAGSLVNHKKTHEVGLFQCVVCYKEFTNPMALKNHIRIHSLDKQYKCKDCGMSFRVAAHLVNHRKIHGERPYHCPVCGEDFLKLSELQHHQTTHSSDAVSQEQSSFSSLNEGSELNSTVNASQSSSIRTLENHDLLGDSNNDGSFISENTTSAQDLNCENLENENAAPQIHVRKKGNTQMEDLHGHIGSPDGDEERPFKCKECGKSYKHAGSLTNHKQTHTTGIYQCSLCFKEYQNLMALKNHIRLHSQYKPYRCSECGKGFRVFTDLTNHQRIHIDENCFTESFSASSDFQQNELLYNSSYHKEEEGDELVKSEDQSNLTHEASEVNSDDNLFDKPAHKPQLQENKESGHYRLHNKINKVRRTISEKLRKSAVTVKPILKGRDNDASAVTEPFYNREIHTPVDHKTHICMYCGGVFSDIEDLRSHKCSFIDSSSTANTLQPRTDSEHLENGHISESENDLAGNDDDSGLLKQEDDLVDRPFKCQVCGRSYRHAGSLINHKKSHQLGVYSCQICLKQFFNLGALKNHLRTHTRSRANSGMKFSTSPETPKPRILQSSNTAYNCIECGESFLSRISFIQHQKKHNTSRETADQLDVSRFQDSSNDGQYSVNEGRLQEPFLPSRDLALSDGLLKHIKCEVEKVKPLDLQNLEQTNSTEISPACNSSKNNVQNTWNPNMQKGAFHLGQSGSTETSPLCNSSKNNTQGNWSLNIQKEAFLDENIYAVKSPRQLSVETVHVKPDIKPSQNSYLNGHVTGSLAEEPAECPAGDCGTSADTEDRPYKCNQCNKAYRHAGSLANHKHTHQKGIYQCPVCEKQMSNLVALRSHLRIHKKYQSRSSFPVPGDLMYYNHFQEKDDSYCCPACGENFSSSSSLQHHLQIVHGSIGEPQNQSIKLSFEESLDHAGLTGAAVAHSEIADGTESGGGVPLSEKVCKNFEYKIESPSRAEDCTDDIYENLTDLPHICGRCGKMYDDMDSLENHSCHLDNGDVMSCLQDDGVMDLQDSSLSAEDPLDEMEQSNCENDVNDVNDAQASPSTEHQEGQDSTEKRTFKCSLCDKTYRHAGSLTNHEHTHRKGDFQCLVCQKMCFNYAAFKSHLRTHSKAKTNMTLCNNRPTLFSTESTRTMLTFSSPYSSGSPGDLDLSYSRPLKEEKEDTAVSLISSEHYSEDAAEDYESFKEGLHKMTSSEITHVGQSQSPTHALITDSTAENTVVKKCSSNLEITDSCPERAIKSEVNYLNGDNSPSGISDKAEEQSFLNNSFDNVKTLENAKTEHKNEDSQSITCSEDSNSSSSSSLSSSSSSSSSSFSSEDPKACVTVDNTGSSKEHRGDQDRPFRCEECGRTYRHAGSLLNHKQTHKTGIFRCSVCLKRFFNLMAFKNHFRIHFQKKPHKCPECGRAFRLQKQLIRHQQVHREKPSSSTRMKSSVRKALQQRAHDLQFSDSCPPDNGSSNLKEEEDPAHISKITDTPTVGAREQFSEKKQNVSSFDSGDLCSTSDIPRYEQNTSNSKEVSIFTQGAVDTEKLDESSVSVERDVPSGPDKMEPCVDRPFKCNQCERSYRHAGSLLNHKKSHTTGDFYCPICEKTYPNLMAMKNHQRIHFEIKRFQCQDCGKAFRGQKQLLKHSHSHADKKSLHCSVCDKNFPSKLQLQEHSKEHKNQKPQISLLDDSCERELEDNREVTVPVKGKCFLTSRKRRAKMKTDASFDHQHSCSNCQSVFSTYKEFEQHYCTFYGQNETSLADCKDSCRDVGSQSSQKPYTENKTLRHDQSECETVQPCDRPDERPYKCDLCGRTYRHAGSLLNHQNTHKTGIFKCYICMKQFFNPVEIKNHLCIHTASRRYKCLECGKAFSLSRELKSHQQVHTGERPYNCSDCGKGFLHKPSLMHHQRVHTSTKYVAKRCKNRKALKVKKGTCDSPSRESPREVQEDAELKTEPGFPVRGIMECNSESVEVGRSRPVRTRKRKRLWLYEEEYFTDDLDIDVRPFKCNQCGKTYRHAGSLLNHKKTHTTGVYLCPVCKKEFSNPMALKSHERIHLEKKQYKCSECSKEFRLSRQLVSHQRVHGRSSDAYTMSFSQSELQRCSLDHSASLQHSAEDKINTVEKSTENFSVDVLR